MDYKNKSCKEAAETASLNINLFNERTLAEWLKPPKKAAHGINENFVASIKS